MWKPEFIKWSTEAKNNYNNIISACQQYVDEEIDRYIDSNPDLFPDNLSEAIEEYTCRVCDYTVKGDNIELEIKFIHDIDSELNIEYDWEEPIDGILEIFNNKNQ